MSRPARPPALFFWKTLFYPLVCLIVLPELLLCQEPSPAPETATEALARPPVTEKTEKKQEDASLPLLSSVGRRNEIVLKLFQAGARREYLVALELKDRGSLREALGRFQDFRVLYPAHPGEAIVLRQIVEIYERLSLPGKALAELKTYLSAQPPGRPLPAAAPLYVKKADLEFRLGIWSESLASYRLFLRMFPGDPALPKVRERITEIQKALTESQSTPANETGTDREEKKNPAPEKRTPPSGRPAADESSLDRLGEGLDSEK